MENIHIFTLRRVSTHDNVIDTEWFVCNFIISMLVIDGLGQQKITVRCTFPLALEVSFKTYEKLKLLFVNFTVPIERERERNYPYLQTCGMLVRASMLFLYKSYL